jgi:hypothetical protein
MAVLLSALVFAVAFVASLLAIWVTIAPRIAYMRSLVMGETVVAVAPAPAPRARLLRPAAVSTMGRPAMRLAA